MEDINKRFKQLRKECNKSQEEWAKIFGLSRSGISEIESGRRKVTNQHLIMLSNWTDRKVNIDYLKNGELPMFLEPEENDLIAQASELLGEKDPLFEAFVSTYAKLSPKNRELIIEFMSGLSDEMGKKKE